MIACGAKRCVAQPHYKELNIKVGLRPIWLIVLGRYISNEDPIFDNQLVRMTEIGPL